MINRFPKIFLLLTTVLFIGTVATLQRIDVQSCGCISKNVWILLGCELGTLLCICLCSLRESHLLHRKVLIQNSQLKRQALHDYLTQCYNRRALFSLLGEMELSADTSNWPLGFLMIDVDNFKRVNDNFGHAQGDRILKEVAQVLQSTLNEASLRAGRPCSDVQSTLGEVGYLARYGGDEFCILLPHYNQEQTVSLGEKLRLAVESSPFTIESVNKDSDESAHPSTRIGLKVTLSIGAVSIPEQKTTIDEILTVADTALYEAKRQGRNRVWSR